MRFLLVPLLCLLAGAAAAQDAKMRLAVEKVLGELPAPLRTQATKPFEDRDRLEWHYTPRSRNGVPFKEMDKPAREATHALLRNALSAAGYRKVTNIIELEIVLRGRDLLREHYSFVRGTSHRH